MRGARAAGRLSLAALALLICLPPHLATVALRHRSRWPRRFLDLATRALGVDLKVYGAALPAGLIVANHRSWLDIPVLAAASGCVFVSKAEVGRWPVTGWLARLHGTVFVERQRRGEARGQADMLRGALAAGRLVALFPEGGTNPNGGVLPFKPSLFAAVCPAPPGTEVQPVLIDYGDGEEWVSWPDGEGTLANMLRVLGRTGRLPVSVRFLPPVDPGAHDDRKALAAACHRALEDAGRVG